MTPLSTGPICFVMPYIDRRAVGRAPSGDWWAHGQGHPALRTADGWLALDRFRAAMGFHFWEGDLYGEDWSWRHGLASPVLAGDGYSLANGRLLSPVGDGLEAPSSSPVGSLRREYPIAFIYRTFILADPAGQPTIQPSSIWAGQRDQGTMFHGYPSDFPEGLLDELNGLGHPYFENWVYNKVHLPTSERGIPSDDALVGQYLDDNIPGLLSPVWGSYGYKADYTTFCPSPTPVGPTPDAAAGPDDTTLFDISVRGVYNSYSRALEETFTSLNLGEHCLPNYYMMFYVPSQDSTNTVEMPTIYQRQIDLAQAANWGHGPADEGGADPNGVPSLDQPASFYQELNAAYAALRDNGESRGTTISEVTAAMEKYKVIVVRPRAHSEITSPGSDINNQFKIDTLPYYIDIQYNDNGADVAPLTHPPSLFNPSGDFIYERVSSFFRRWGMYDILMDLIVEGDTGARSTPVNPSSSEILPDNSVEFGIFADSGDTTYVNLTWIIRQLGRSNLWNDGDPATEPAGGLPGASSSWPKMDLPTGYTDAFLSIQPGADPDADATGVYLDKPSFWTGRSPFPGPTPPATGVYNDAISATLGETTNLAAATPGIIAFSQFAQFDSMKDDLRTLIVNLQRTPAELFEGVGCYSETVAYKIEKYRVHPSTGNRTNVQTFYIPCMPNPADDSCSFRYIDTQVIYGFEYVYDIHPIKIVVGTVYGYADVNVSTTATKGNGRALGNALGFYEDLAGPGGMPGPHNANRWSTWMDDYLRDNEDTSDASMHRGSFVLAHPSLDGILCGLGENEIPFTESYKSGIRLNEQDVQPFIKERVSLQLRPGDGVDKNEDGGAIAEALGAWKPAVPYVMTEAEETWCIFNDAMDVDEECFVAGTKVAAIIDGQIQLVNIEDLQSGDLVMSYNLVSRSTEAKSIVRTSSPIHSDIVEFGFSNGTTTQHTYDHPYYVENKGWSSYTPEKTIETYKNPELENTSRIEIGDRCRLISGELVTLVAITEVFSGPTQTYNIVVEDNHNYFADEILVHNKTVEGTPGPGPGDPDDPPMGGEQGPEDDDTDPDDQRMLED